MRRASEVAVVAVMAVLAVLAVMEFCDVRREQTAQRAWKGISTNHYCRKPTAVLKFEVWLK